MDYGYFKGVVTRYFLNEMGTPISVAEISSEECPCPYGWLPDLVLCGTVKEYTYGEGRRVPMLWNNYQSN